jgi:hypothetical protein
VIEILDQEGVRLTTATNTVTVAIASGVGTLTGTAILQAVGGVVTFSGLGISGTGSFTLSFQSTGLTGVTSGSFTVAPRVATSLRMVTQPGGTVDGQVFGTQPVVEILDQTGQPLTTATNTVTVAIASGTGTLSGTATVQAVGGVATFSGLSISGTGTFTLSFASAGLTGVTSASFTVAPRVATSLRVVTQPGGAVDGQVFGTQPVVEILDQTGQPLTTATNAVTVAITSGQGTLSGTATVQAVGGVATFSGLSISGTGTFTLSFVSTSLTAVTSGGFEVAAGVPTSLVIVQQPAGAVAGQPFTTQPIVQILDQTGNLIRRVTATVTATSSTGVLSGMRNISLTNLPGEFAFSDLSLGSTGSYVLTFSSGDLPPINSDTLVVASASVATTLQVTLSQPSVVGNVVQTASAVVRDQFGQIMDAPVVWSMTDPLVARVDTSGVIQALGAGSTQVVAQSSGLQAQAPLSVSFGASQFAITYEFLVPTSVDIQNAFLWAAGRWSQAIVGDLPSARATNLDVSECTGVEGKRFNGTIDDILIYVQVDSIDGVGGVLGSAGPCFIRNNSGSPVIGIVRLDRDDLENLAGFGLLNDVILHEIGHVLGLGTLWNVVDPATIGTSPECRAQDPVHPGPGSRWVFPLLVPDYAGRTVPLENCGGEGTRNGHWRESVLRRELMTGFLNTSGNPLSPLTLGAILDLDVGYAVDLSQHDSMPWTVSPPPGRETIIHIHERMLPPPPIRILDSDGSVLPRPD